MTDLAATTALMGRRRAVMGPSYRHFFEEPLQPVRAEGVWLYDAGAKPISTVTITCRRSGIVTRLSSRRLPGRRQAAGDEK